jgi:hypothetical protein
MDKYCDTCRDLEALHYDKTEFYVSLLDQQNKIVGTRKGHRSKSGR